MKINIQNLEKDLVEIETELENTFLNQELTEFYPGKSKVHVTLDKFGKDYRVDIELETRAHYVCDRCLADFENHFKASQRQLFHLGDVTEIDQDEIIQIASNATEIDLSPFLAEMFILNHPIKMICSDDCKGLCPKCGADLNHEDCRCNSEVTDPRWEELRKLIK